MVPMMGRIELIGVGWKVTCGCLVMGPGGGGCDEEGSTLLEEIN
jgi:hypothetical protein